MFLDKVAVSFCPEDKSLDLFFDQRGYLFLDTAESKVADIPMEVEEPDECFGGCLESILALKKKT